jgi:hypothetical protein
MHEALRNYNAAKVEHIADRMEKGTGTPAMQQAYDYAMRHRYFAVWLFATDSVIQRAYGIGLFDLGDVPLRDYFDDGITPREAAQLTLEQDDTFGAML